MEMFLFQWILFLSEEKKKQKTEFFSSRAKWYCYFLALWLKCTHQHSNDVKVCKNHVIDDQLFCSCITFFFSTNKQTDKRKRDAMEQYNVVFNSNRIIFRSRTIYSEMKKKMLCWQWQNTVTSEQNAWQHTRHDECERKREWDETKE